MSAPAGWYPDPQQSAPGAPPQQRYWDGRAWTAKVAPIARPGGQQPAPNQPAQPQSEYPGQQAQYPGRSEYGGQQTQDQQAGYQQSGYGSQYVAPPTGAPTTPDGARLAGWWHRVGAYIIDALILSVIVTVLAYPYIRDVVGAFGEFFDATMRAAQSGEPAPTSAQFESDIAGAAGVIAGISLVVNLVYTVVFLMWKQATPGKLALGLRVRLRESPDLPLPAVLLRWATQSAVPGLLGALPFLGIVGGIFSALDVLWPLWDGKRQALHDKVARTNVIRIR